jgi:hypothetical protein
MPLILDLFSGLGGASKPFRDRGWQVVTVELDPKFSPDIVADVSTFSWRGERPTLIWASPPCTEFARESMPWSRTGKAPDLSLVQAVYRVVGESKPVWWVVENVRGAQRWIGRAVMNIGPVYLWGWFPPFKSTPAYGKERLSSKDKAERARIPYEIGASLADVIEECLAPQAAELVVLEPTSETQGSTVMTENS